ncbi:hypothetical protein BSKO_11040 [Bryopsis sp. KO-2023]|nr:hypothetical protein BSKO_11040 [Bryopsis sp. KO-2023]
MFASERRNLAVSVLLLVGVETHVAAGRALDLSRGETSAFVLPERNGRKPLSLTTDNCMTFVNPCTKTHWNLAIAFQSSYQVWRSQGWYVIKPGSEETICWDSTGSSNVWVYLNRNSDLKDETGCQMGQARVQPKSWLRSASFCIDGGNRFNIVSQAKEVGGEQQSGYGGKDEGAEVWSSFTEELGITTTAESCRSLGPLCYFMAQFFEITDGDTFVLSTCGKE